MPKARGVLFWTLSTVTCLLVIVTVVMVVQLQKQNQSLTKDIESKNGHILKVEDLLSEKEKAALELDQKLKETEAQKAEAQKNLDQKAAELQKKQDELQKKAEEADALKGSVNDLKKKLKDAEARKTKKEAERKIQLVSAPKTKVAATAAAKNTSKPIQASAPKGKTIQVSATAYTAYCNGCSGITATGFNLRANPGAKVIAVDPRVIPLGSKVHVEGYGTAIASDTGGAIKGNKIDVFIPNQSSALRFGRKTLTVTILN